MHMPHPRPVSSSPGTEWNARPSRSAYCLCASNTLAGTSLISACPSLLTLGTNSSLGAFPPNKLQILLLGTGMQSRGPRHGSRFCLRLQPESSECPLGRQAEPYSGQKQNKTDSPPRPGAPQLPSVPLTATEEALSAQENQISSHPHHSLFAQKLKAPQPG